MSTSARIFSFGLGYSPSRALVKGLARTTNGRFVFIPSNSSVDVYVGEQLQRTLQPAITNVEVEWKFGIPVTNVPTKPPPVYANDRFIVYALANDSGTTFNDDASVELHVNRYRLSVIKASFVSNTKNNGTIARLAVKALILELQHAKIPSNNIRGSLQTRLQNQTESSTSSTTITTTTAAADKNQITKQRIIELSLKYNILNPYTAFVGIEKRANQSNAEMVLREVPIDISADDQHLLAEIRIKSCFRMTSAVRPPSSFDIDNFMAPSCASTCRSALRPVQQTDIQHRAKSAPRSKSFRPVSISMPSVGLMDYIRSFRIFKKLNINLDNPNWNGTWHGSLINYPTRSESSPVDVLTEMGPYPTSDNTCAMWRNTYLQDGKVQGVKDYRLCRGQGADDLVIDEGNGVKLETRWIGDVLVTPFKYDNLLFISSTRLHGDILQEEILIIDDKPAIKGPLSMHARSIQRIETKRVKS
ncbi:unnamed protein product [Rotaria sp. Silwood2]|nr:unnamed protein product [Rotaria sp. Silwood2]CAF2792495.1 unnamed protein product [Rotaria sp. Silwood2]CAF3232187.1 unnamed protein product [Rotaria sp. Silwood2]CAF4190903.1 unnamed protein product [Rotaria sp. Silwood2]CAF4211824.1 unnamed protein product [Rotaria sp. Silwood2]